MQTPPSPTKLRSPDPGDHVAQPNHVPQARSPGIDVEGEAVGPVEAILPPPRVGSPEHPWTREINPPDRQWQCGWPSPSHIRSRPQASIPQVSLVEASRPHRGAARTKERGRPTWGNRKR